jgi:uncharacterized protein YhdP
MDKHIIGWMDRWMDEEIDIEQEDLSAYGWMCIQLTGGRRWAVALTGPGMLFAAYSHTNGAI